MTPSITEAQVLAAVRGFLVSILPGGTDVIKGQGNVVPEPQEANFVVFTPTRRDRLSTTVETWDMADPEPVEITYTQPTKVTLQLDVHGEASSDNGQAVTTLWRSAAGVAMLAGSGVVPLYCDEGNQMPFVNAEGQYEDRWVVSLTLQVNPALSTPQQFADTLTAGVIEIDSAYPPGV